jgi:RloB-like protein
MGARRRTAKSLGRRGGTRQERRTILVFTEGKNSEPDYLRGLKSLSHIASSTSVSIQVALEHAVPLTLVKCAVEKLKEPEDDECWAIFDVEWPQNHPHLREAIALAERNGVRIAVSNPCFEVWLILHLADHTAFLDTSTADRVSRSLDSRPGKNIDPDVYLPHRALATERARRLAARHVKNGTSFPQDNPSSSMSDLVESLESQAQNSRTGS